MSNTLIAALFISVIVFTGNIIYYKKQLQIPINWKRTLISTAICMVFPFIIEWLWIVAQRIIK